MIGDCLENCWLATSNSCRNVTNKKMVQLTIKMLVPSLKIMLVSQLKKFFYNSIDCKKTCLAP